ncbi:MAG: helix-turn-helix domain-containing protein [Leptospiraceae bacterium]|nr:helix-turn-helix domain-containing protein [Leptospiraceae bacterium]
MEKNLLYYISFFGCFLALLFSIGYKISPNQNSKKNLVSFALLLVGIFLFHNVYLFSDFFPKIPYFYLYHLPILFLFGPILSRVIYLFLEGEIPHWLRNKWNLVPFALSFLFTVYGFFDPITEKWETIQSIRAGTYLKTLPRIEILSFLGCSHLLFYILRSFLHFVRIFRFEKLVSTPSVRFLFLILGMASFGTLGGLLISFGEIRIGLSIGIFFLSAIVPTIYLIQMSYPSLFEEVKFAIQEEKKYLNSQLKNINTSDLKEHLLHLFGNQKVFLEEDLNLSNLAERMQISSHQLSEYLNTQEGKSFPNFLNYYRIEHACDLLQKNPYWPTIRIAYESGFQSKSSFHEAFRKEKGITPTEFRKKNSPL